jgi:hypothetical protein
MSAYIAKHVDRWTRWRVLRPTHRFTCCMVRPQCVSGPLQPASTGLSPQGAHAGKCKCTAHSQWLWTMVSPPTDMQGREAHEPLSVPHCCWQSRRRTCSDQVNQRCHSSTRMRATQGVLACPTSGITSRHGHPDLQLEVQAVRAVAACVGHGLGVHWLLQRPRPA